MGNPALALPPIECDDDVELSIIKATDKAYLFQLFNYLTGDRNEFWCGKSLLSHDDVSYCEAELDSTTMPVVNDIDVPLWVLKDQEWFEPLCELYEIEV